MRIIIPIPQKISSNKFYSQSLHWSERKKIADLYHNSLIEQRNERVTDFPCEVSFTFKFKSRMLDVDNTATMAKLLIDSMRAWKIIPDDSPKYISALHLYIEKSDKDEVEIDIT